MFLLELGVYNCVKNTLHTLSFEEGKEESKFKITLDLYKSKIQISLDGTVRKELSLEGKDGPWVPCIKLTQDNSRVTLNPYVSQHPSSKDIQITLREWLLSHLHNFICYTFDSSVDFNDLSLKDKFKSKVG